MRSIEDKEVSSNSSSNTTFEFHKGNGGTAAASRGSNHHRTALGKPTPSKWDDAQKWIANLSRGGGVGLGVEKNQSKTKPRNSNADDTRLIAPVPQQENDYMSGEEFEVDKEANMPAGNVGFDVETKNVVDSEDSYWRINKSMDNSGIAVRSICVRDMGTDMTPIASQEPSRTATPIRATTPVRRSPISSGASTPMRCQHGVVQNAESFHAGLPPPIDSSNRTQASPLGRGNAATRVSDGGGNGDVEGGHGSRTAENKNPDEQSKKLNPLESRAMAWDEAERAKYTARYKREEVKIQAWENHEKRKAEMEMKKMEVKAERMKARAQEKFTNKLASTRRIAEEKRANAEAKLNEKAVKTSEKADYIRRTGHLPSTFNFKLPSCCW